MRNFTVALKRAFEGCANSTTGERKTPKSPLSSKDAYQGDEEESTCSLGGGWDGWRGRVFMLPPAGYAEDEVDKRLS